MGYNFFNKKHCTNVKERIIPRELLDLKLETKQQLLRNKRYHSWFSRENSFFNGIQIEDREIKMIEKAISEIDIQEEIKKAYTDNKSMPAPEQYVIYTDGSFIAKESEPKMGAAFIQTEGNNIGNTIQVAIQEWPSANKAEVSAIALALLTMPENAKIIIKTDCINCITTFEKLNKQYLRLTHKKWLKINNWII